MRLFGGVKVTNGYFFTDKCHYYSGPKAARIDLGSVDISDYPPHVMPECLNRASISFGKAGFPLETCGNDMP
jgi:hypothetical protein